MKKDCQHKLVLAVIIFSVIFLFSTTFVTYGLPSLSNNCSVSSCHDMSTGMSITISPSVVEVNVSSTFSLNITAIGQIAKFPSELVDNDNFLYVGLDDEGTVWDGDFADLNAGYQEISIEYSIIAPDIAGSYTLQFFSVIGAPFSNFTYIFVNVVDPASFTTSTSPTSPSPTTPTFPPPIPLVNWSTIFSAYFIFAWGVLILLTLVPAIFVLRRILRNRILIVGILMETFGWADYWLAGRFDLLAPTLIILGIILITYGEIMDRQDEASDIEGPTII